MSAQVEQLLEEIEMLNGRISEYVSNGQDTTLLKERLNQLLTRFSSQVAAQNNHQILKG